MKRKDERLITYQKIEAFGQWLESYERSVETIKKYRRYLKQFKEFIGGESVTKKTVLLWRANLREHITSVAISCVIAALNGFFRYCGWDGYEGKFLKISKSFFCPERKELTKDKYKRLIKTAFDNGDERPALVLETICASGIHVSELSFITVAAIHKDQAEIECGSRIRTILLTRQLCSFLRSHAQESNISSGMIFVTGNDKPLDRNNMWREMKALGIEANVKTERIFPHNLRHLSARTYYEIEKNLSKLTDILGHRDVNTTRIYTKESGNQHRIQLEKMRLLLYNTTEYFFCYTLGYS